MAHRDRLLAAAGPLAAAVIGGLATYPGSRWFRRLDKPVWCIPPPQTVTGRGDRVEMRQGRRAAGAGRRPCRAIGQAADGASTWSMM
jgi:hypothetical protein